MAFNHTNYNRRFIANPGNDATKYGIKIELDQVARGQTYFRCIGIHHLTGSENHGQHNVFCDVLDEQGKRLNGATLVVVNANGKINHIRIDKPDNEAGTNAPMHFDDTLEFYVATDGRPSDHAKGFHIRHGDDDPPGTTRGHHSFYVVWQRATAGQLPPVEEPPIEEEPPPTPAPAYTISGPHLYAIMAEGGAIAQVINQEWARRIVAALKVLDASEESHRVESYIKGLRALAGDE